MSGRGGKRSEVAGGCVFVRAVGPSANDHGAMSAQWAAEARRSSVRTLFRGSTSPILPAIPRQRPHTKARATQGRVDTDPLVELSVVTNRVLETNLRVATVEEVVRALYRLPRPRIFPGVFKVPRFQWHKWRLWKASQQSIDGVVDQIPTNEVVEPWTRDARETPIGPGPLAANRARRVGVMAEVDGVQDRR